MKTFITEQFLLDGEFARELYFNYAADQPIYDYHCHLIPQQIAENHRFENLYDIWLSGDHYKWRAMRTNGMAERLCTGDATPHDKYLAFVRTVPFTARNPLYHWSHLELWRYFGIDLLINEANANAIWEQANEKLRQPEFYAHGILARNKVSVICTCDDPADSLEFHEQIRKSDLKTRVYPSFRPDLALKIDNPEIFNKWCDKLASISGVDCSALDGFLDALKQRHDQFHEIGCRLSDHGLKSCFAAPCSKQEASQIFAKARQRHEVHPEETARFGTYLMIYFGHLDAARGWTKQLHLGAMGNNSSRLMKKAGPNVGCDSIGDFPQAQSLSFYLDALDSTGQLPKIVLYNINPADNYVMATMAGSFQDGSVPGKIQFGSGWWFLDQKEGMEWQISALSNLGLLSRFVGMLTDSRSFLSYTRHEYFRRLLCNIIGSDVEKGLLPRDSSFLGGMVSDICFNNARNYFEMECG